MTRISVQLGRRLLLLLLLLLLHRSTATDDSEASESTGTDKGSPSWDLKDALAYCETLGDLYQGIEDDLAVFKAGIDRAAVADSIRKFTTRNSNKGIALAFLGGKAYVVEASLGPRGVVGHHANIFFTYMQVMLELQNLFGDLIPDVEFVIASSDRPMVLLNSSLPYPPVFRFCSSPVHADIQIPIFHFYTKKYTQSSLAVIPQGNEEFPWESKKEVLFGRFSAYTRHIPPNEPLLFRRGTENKTICKVESEFTTACRVRQHFIIWAERFPELMDVKTGPRLPMDQHGKFKYLLHLDGQALSSRLDLLLPLNSLIFKEQSSYTTFYHHLLKPHEHFVPVWKETPDDVLEALHWAKSHDQEAQRIALNAQRFALKYLDKRARSCYWFRLLVEYSKLLRYKVSPEHEVEEDRIAQETARMKREQLERAAELKKANKEKGGAQASEAGRQPEEGNTVRHTAALLASDSVPNDVGGDSEETGPLAGMALLAIGGSGQAQATKERRRRSLAGKRQDKVLGEIVLGKWRTVEEYLRTVPEQHYGKPWWQRPELYDLDLHFA